VQERGSWSPTSAPRPQEQQSVDSQAQRQPMRFWRGLVEALCSAQAYRAPILADVTSLQMIVCLTTDPGIANDSEICKPATTATL
jgi:hypothetical protein